MKMIAFEICIGMLLATFSSADGNTIPEINEGIPGLLNGDLMLAPGETESDYFQVAMNSFKVVTGSGRNWFIESKVWPYASIPFEYGSNFAPESRAAVEVAIKEYREQTCILFYEIGWWNWFTWDYVYFSSDQKGCKSYVGKKGGKQVLNMAKACGKKRIAVHEMMHAIGYLHEQSRYDRNDYIDIITANIKDGKERNFRKMQSGYYSYYSYPYDYKSVLHYKRKAFSKNGGQTIIRKDGVTEDFGQPNNGGLTDLDAIKINFQYGCSGWAQWQDFGVCTKDCGGGQRHSYRRCTKNSCYGDSYRSEDCNTQSCDTGGGDCFPSDAFVRNKKGLKIAMKDLKLGEKVLTMDSIGRPVYSEIAMMLHRDVNQTASYFVTIATQDGRQITLTSHHLIPVSTVDFIFAKDVKPGQNVTTFDEIQEVFKTAEVTYVELVTKTGLYAPMSMEGTLVVNDVYVSCYAEFSSHSISHLVFSLWRIMYANIGWLLSYRTDVHGIHWYPSALKSAASHFNLLPL